MTQIRKFLKINEVMVLVGLSRSTIYQKVKEKTFPAPYKLTNYAVAWLSTEIDEWFDGITRNASPPAANKPQGVEE